MGRRWTPQTTARSASLSSAFGLTTSRHQGGQSEDLPRRKDPRRDPFASEDPLPICPLPPHGHEPARQKTYVDTCARPRPVNDLAFPIPHAPTHGLRYIYIL